MSGKLKGAFGVLLAIVVIAAAAFLIWRFDVIKKLSSIGIGSSNTYLVVHEWSVRFRIGDELSALLYSYDAAGDKVYFTTSSLRAKGGACLDATLGSLARTAKPTASAMQIGDYYYSYTPMSGNACSNVEETRKIQESQTAALTKAIMSLEKAP